MRDVLDNLRRLGRGRLIVLGAVGLGLVGAVLLGLGVAMTPNYAPLHRDLDPARASRMVAALEQAGHRVSVSTDGATLSVPREEVARARMALADAGLLSEGLPGWELFDASGGMGASTFVQKINRLRALEGELSRSIRTIDGIHAARVHLVLPEREAFSRSRPEPSASVIVRTRPGEVVSPRNAVAIRALVAAAVPDLAPGRIALLSASGETILGPDDDQAGTALQSRRAVLEERLSASILRILGARVGADNVRVQVNVELSATRQVVRSESFDPAGRVVRSTETREETTREREGAAEVGVAQNLPAAFAETGGAEGPTAETERTDEVVNYEISSTRTETVSEPGAIERISVAVLVDGVAGADGTTPRDAAEIAQLSGLVRAAIGYDEARGDTVSVESMAFSRPEDAALGGGGTAMADLLSAALPSAVRGAFALLVVGAVLAFGVRPALRTLAPPAALPPPPAEPLAVVDAAAPPAELAADAGPPRIVPPDPAPPVMLSERLGVAGVPGGVSREAIERARGLVADSPEEALRTVRGWLAADAEARA